MKRELIFTFCCLLTTLVWSQEYQRTETGIKASIFGKKIDVEVQWFNANSLRVLKMGQCKKLRGKFINCYLCLQIHSLWS